MLFKYGPLPKFTLDWRYKKLTCNQEGLASDAAGLHCMDNRRTHTSKVELTQKTGSVATV